MRPRRLALAAIAFAACSGARPVQSTPKPEGCVYDAAAHRSCDEKGADWSYQPIPDERCMGQEPPPDVEAAYQESIRTSPCTCVDTRRRAEPCMAP